MKGLVTTKDTTRTSSQHKDFFVPEVLKAGNKKQRQEIKDKGNEKRCKGMRERIFILEGHRIVSG